MPADAAAINLNSRAFLGHGLFYDMEKSLRDIRSRPITFRASRGEESDMNIIISARLMAMCACPRHSTGRVA